jgi:TPR repeat protein
MYNLGCCYADGLGVARDGGKAARWFAEAARRGHDTGISDAAGPAPPLLHAAGDGEGAGDGDALYKGEAGGMFPPGEFSEVGLLPY